MSPSPGQKRFSSWFMWTVSTSIGGLLLGYGLFVDGTQRRLFMPGETSAGHHQIELECKACHTSAFGGAAELSAACERCHASQLERAKDSHPKSKFSDPRHAGQLEALDVRLCITCHREHRMEVTQAAGLTLPQDYCVQCHANVAAERASHRGLSFATCDDAGCHNFHDNRALYEDFLVSRLGEPSLLASAQRPASPKEKRLGPILSTAEKDEARQLGLPRDEIEAWANSAHGRARVECSDCHAAEPDRLAVVSAERCAECHAPAVRSWQAGKHGMRSLLELRPMQAGGARLPMHGAVSGRSLTCNACHAAHAHDREFAAVQACLGCHADDHTTAYTSSRHAALFEEEQRGLVPAGSGVSCATCHLPQQIDEDGAVTTQHDQNDNLRPNEKMIRSVCNRCHGLGFSLDALADPALIRRNFDGPPAVHVVSLEMAARRAEPTPDE